MALKIPYAAHPDGRLVHAASAERAVSHRCPQCHSTVTLRRGEVRTPHFAHRLDPSGLGGCSEETVLHRVAKMLIVQAVMDWRQGRGPAPTILRRCPKGHERQQVFPLWVTRAAEEVRLSGGRIADVGIFDAESCRVAIEICVTNPVSEVKEEQLSIPFLEVLGEDVLRDPIGLRPVREGLRPLRCPTCEAEKRELERLLDLEEQRDREKEEKRIRAEATRERREASAYKDAKRWVAQAFETWRAGGRWPVILIEGSCWHPTTCALPSGVRSVVTDAVWDGIQTDVTLVGENSPLFIVQVHSINHWSSLPAIDVPSVVVGALPTLANRWRWRALSGRGVARPCKGCAVRIEGVRKMLSAPVEPLAPSVPNPVKTVPRHPGGGPPLEGLHDDKTGRCVVCGKVTGDWVIFNGATKTCKCRACVYGKR